MTHVKEDDKVLREKQIEERKPLMQALAFALLWGAVTYGYAAANLIISHDSLYEFVSPKKWKVGLGRVFEPIYQTIVRSNLLTPWIIAMLSVAFIGLAVYALTRALDLTSAWDVLLTAGAMGGLYGMVLVLCALLCALCRMRSLGAPLTAPVAPPRRRNPDILLRLPLQFQKARAFFAKGHEDA